MVYLVHKIKTNRRKQKMTFTLVLAIVALVGTLTVGIAEVYK
ncbi:hypothetical protein LKMCDIF_00061 [Enterococcus phage vB_OCPT_CCS4]|nr:hypothetical protein LKMCDIF_00061 [Enterococcus phage vB_OCPT_CCS4]